MVRMALARLTRANRPLEQPKRPRSGKSAHEDRRHGVFSGEVVSRYPRRGTPGSWAGRSTARRRAPYRLRVRRSSTAICAGALTLAQREGHRLAERRAG